MRAAAHMSTLASAAPSGGSASSTRAHRCAAGVLLIGALSVTAACTSSAKSHDKKSAGSSSGSTVASGQPSSAAVNVPPAPTTPVPPPSPGDISHTVAVRPASVKPAVPLKTAGNFGGSVTVHVTGIRSATAQARGAGEVSGPGLVITLQFDNASAKTIDLGNVVVALADSKAAPGSPMSAPPAHPFSGKLAAGGHASAVYVFTIPKADRKPITLSVSYTSAAPVVVFSGDAP
jgi:hypothetical protein